LDPAIVEAAAESLEIKNNEKAFLLSRDLEELFFFPLV
jgi:hypothetical protein